MILGLVRAPEQALGEICEGSEMWPTLGNGGYCCVLWNVIPLLMLTQDYLHMISRRTALWLGGGWGGPNFDMSVSPSPSLPALPHGFGREQQLRMSSEGAPSCGSRPRNTSSASISGTLGRVGRVTLLT